MLFNFFYRNDNEYTVDLMAHVHLCGLKMFELFSFRLQCARFKFFDNQNKIINPSTFFYFKYDDYLNFKEFFGKQIKQNQSTV